MHPVIWILLILVFCVIGAGVVPPNPSELLNSLRMQELVELFGASESTIRRDITALDKAGRVTKVFGGAMAKDVKVSHKELSVSQKEDLHMEEKKAIARYAASLIEPDDYVYLDVPSFYAVLDALGKASHESIRYL